MKFNRKLVLVLALVLSVAMATTGTLAYLTDRDSAANVFTMGNLTIELNEGDFDNNNDNVLLPGGPQISKKPSVKNTSSNVEAYVWIELAVPTGAMRETVDSNANSPYGGAIHFDFLGAEGSVWHEYKEVRKTGADAVEINGKLCDVYTFLFNDRLLPGCETDVLFHSVYMDASVDITPEGDVYSVVNGVATSLQYNINDGELPVYVSAYAIQATDGNDMWESVEAAYDIYHNQWGEYGSEYGSTANDQDSLNEALKNGTSTIVLSAGEYTLPAVKDKTVTIVGKQNTIIDMANSKMNAAGVATDGLDITFDGVTVKFDNMADYKGIQHAKKVVYKNCTIIGKQFMYAEDVEFINCTFENYDNYAVWTYGANNTTFAGCTFLTGGKAILVYSDSASGATHNVNVDSCIFYDNGAMATDKAAIEVHKYNYGDPAKISLTMTDNKVYGFAVNGKGYTNSKLYSDEGNYVGSGIMTVENASNTIHTDSDYYIADVNSLFAFADAVNGGNNYSGKTVKLLEDIDLQNKEWTPIGQSGSSFKGTFDGNNKTICNLNVTTTGDVATGFFGSNICTIKNLTINGAYVSGNHWAGVIAGHCSNIVNCHVKNAEVISTHLNNDACGDKAGAVLGLLIDGNCVLKNCSATNCTVTAGRDAGQIVGACYSNDIVENNIATNVEVVSGEGCTGENINNSVYGRMI